MSRSRLRGLQRATVLLLGILPFGAAPARSDADERATLVLVAASAQDALAEAAKMFGEAKARSS